MSSQSTGVPKGKTPMLGPSIEEAIKGDSFACCLNRQYKRCGRQSSQSHDKMTRWEYWFKNTPRLNGMTSRHAGKAGRDGWELIAATENESGDLSVFLERPIERQN